MLIKTTVGYHFTPGQMCVKNLLDGSSLQSFKSPHEDRDTAGQTSHPRLCCPNL